MSADSADPFTKPSLTAMKMLGLWPVASFGNDNIYSAIHKSFGVFVTICYTLFTAMMFADVFINRDDLKAVIENLSITFMYLCSGAKSIVYLFTSKTMQDLAKHALEFSIRVKNTRDPKRLKILNEYVRHSYYVTFGFWSVAGSTITGFCTAPLLNVIAGARTEPSHLIFRAWNPFQDIWSGYLLQLVLIYMTVLMTASLSTLTAVLIIIPTCEFKILSIDLEEMVETEEDPGDYLQDPKDLKKEIVKWVKNHLKVIRYVNRLDGILNHLLLLDFITYSGLFCMIFFQYIIAGFKFESLVSTTYILTMINHIMLIYWTGNEVIVNSEMLANSAYNSVWYKAPAWYQSNLKIIIRRCQKPLKLRVWRLYNVSLETFLKIMSASYSYFAILRHIYSDK